MPLAVGEEEFQRIMARTRNPILVVRDFPAMPSTVAQMMSTWMSWSISTDGAGSGGWGGAACSWRAGLCSGGVFRGGCWISVAPSFFCSSNMY